MDSEKYQGESGMRQGSYIMENDEEVLRLDVKTDNSVTERQARWAGLKPGMRVADIGCGSGKTTSKLHELVQPGGRAVGVDIAQQRVTFATEKYATEGLDFCCADARKPLDQLGEFDFIWVRFLLEYYRADSFEIVKNIIKTLKPGGTLCLLDLDYNCLSHYGLSGRLERTIVGILKALEQKADFDPYVGRKLYSYLYDLGFEDIQVKMTPHHLIYGPLKESDDFNWTKKVEVAGRKLGNFDEYPGGFEEFYQEFKAFFNDPRRFTYTPLIACRGRMPNR